MTRTEADQMKNFDGEGRDRWHQRQPLYRLVQRRGRTGSAEYRREDGETGTHSWFVGFSNVDDHDIVVAIIKKTRVQEAQRQFLLQGKFLIRIIVVKFKIMLNGLRI